MENLAPAIEAPVDYGVTAEVRAPQNLYALKDKDTFIVADQFGDIAGQGDGLFHNDTRILSFYRLTLGGHAPLPWWRTPPRLASSQPRRVRASAAFPFFLYFSAHATPNVCSAALSPLPGTA